MVFAFAGLSTITSFLADMAPHLSDRLGYCRHGAPAKSRLSPRRRAQLAAAEGLVSVARARKRALACGRRLRARREPQLELRPVAARDSALPEALSPLHGQVGALLDAVQAVRHRRRGVPGPPRPGRAEAMATAMQLCREGQSLSCSGRAHDGRRDCGRIRGPRAHRCRRSQPGRAARSASSAIRAAPVCARASYFFRNPFLRRVPSGNMTTM